MLRSRRLDALLEVMRSVEGFRREKVFGRGVTGANGRSGSQSKTGALQ